MGTSLLRRYVQVRNSERGATAVEYGLIVALIAAVIVVAVGLLGGQINNAFQDVVDRLPGANPNP